MPRNSGPVPAPYCIKPSITRERDFAGHIKRGSHHVLRQINCAKTRTCDPFTAAFCSCGHDRGEIANVSVRKDRSGCSPLPTPMRPFGDKQRISDRRAQQVFRNNRLGIIFQILQENMSDCRWISDHMPSLSSTPGNDWFFHRQIGNYLEQVFTRGFQTLNNTHRLSAQSD